MSVVKSKKFQITILKKDKNAVLDLLQENSFFSSSAFSSDEIAAYGQDSSFLENERNKGEIEFAISFLSGFADNKKGLKYALLGNKEIMTSGEVKALSSEFDYASVTSKAKELEKNLNTIKNRRNEINKEFSVLKEFDSIDFDLSEISNLTGASVYIGSIKKLEFSLIKEEIGNFSDLTDVILIKSGKTHVSFAIVYVNDIQEGIQNIIGNFSCNEFKDFQKYSCVRDFLSSLKSELSDMKKEEKVLVSEAKSLAKKLPKLKACFDNFFWKVEKGDVLQNAGSTESTIFLKGWILENKIKLAQKQLSEVTSGNFDMTELELEEGEKTPITIENKPLFRPFENVTSLYGLPKSNEFDPTPFVSIFFWIFFAFCLTDAVYGLILLIGSLSVLKFMIVPRESRGFFILLSLVGLSTTILGVLFGGYAGLQEYGLIPDSLMSLQTFDMVKGMETVMGLAFGLGFLHLLLGVIIKGVHSWKEGNKLSAVFMNFAWPAFFAAIALLVLYEAPGEYIYAAVGLLALSLSYDTKGFMKVVAGPFNVLNGTIEWGSNVLSYARLFALGISTGIIAIVFNQIAMTLGGMLPTGISFVVMVIIVLFGHVLNIAMNSLGAFIHSARLQFVEFYGKFMEGGGEAFKPFSKKSQYIYIEDK